MPDNVDIGQGWTLRVAALSSTDGSTVSGVKISNMVLEVAAVGSGSLESGVFAPVLLRQAGA